MMGFAWNLLLALLWMGLIGSFEGPIFLQGFALGYFALYVLEPQLPVLGNYSRRMPRFIGFVVYASWELLKSNYSVLKEVITPGLQISPAVIGFPLTAKSDIEIVILANLITLTPGTVSIDVSDDRSTLYIHSLYFDDEESFIAGIKDMEGHVLRTFR